MNRRKNLIGLVIYSVLFIHYLIVLQEYDSIYYKNRKQITSVVFRIAQKFHRYYFTVWNFTVQILFVGLAALSEFFVLINMPRIIRDIFNGLRSYLFNTIVFPSSVFVASCFWFLYFLDRKLILPDDVDIFYPIWMNHSVHSAIIVPLLLELYLPKRFSTISPLLAAKIWSVYVLIYQVLFIGIYLYHRIWLYPIFMYLSWEERLSFLFALYLFTLCLLLLGIFIQYCKELVE